MILEYQPSILGPPSQDLIPLDCIKQMPKEAKACSSEVQHCDLDFCPATSPQDPEHHLMVTAAKATFGLHIPHEPFLGGEYEIQKSTSPH